MRLAPTLIATAAASTLLLPSAASAADAEVGNYDSVNIELSELIGTDSFTELGEVDVDLADAILDSLEVGEKKPSEKYDRSKHFGSGWLDPDGNGCDARNDILARDLKDTTIDDDGCTVLSGTLDDIFTNTTIDFTRGVGTSTAVQIDHMVPLSYAWTHGAEDLSADERRDFANNPINLTAMDGPTNGSKGDRGPGSWMPPNEDYSCTYSARFVYALSYYDLSISEADKTAVAENLDSCPNPQAAEETFPVGESLEHLDLGDDFARQGILAFRVTGDPGTVEHGRTRADVRITRDGETVYELKDQPLSPGAEPGAWEFSTFQEGTRDGVVNTIADMDPFDGPIEVTVTSHDSDTTQAWEVTDTFCLGECPSEPPTGEPTTEPTDEPSETPSEQPTTEPTDPGSDEPTEDPSATPTEDPAEQPSDDPTETPAAPAEATMELSTTRLSTTEFADEGVDIRLSGLAPGSEATLEVSHDSAAMETFTQTVTADAAGDAGLNVRPIGTTHPGTYTVVGTGENLDETLAFDVVGESAESAPSGQPEQKDSEEKTKHPLVKTGGSLARTGADTASALTAAAALIAGGSATLWLTIRRKA